MDDETREALEQLLPALKSLVKTVGRSIDLDTYEGTGGMAVRSYRGLHSKVAALFPEDFYITESLVLDVSEDAGDREKVAQVQMASDQLVSYLQGQFSSGRKSQRQRRQRMVEDASEAAEEIKELGQELRDNILRFTKDTMRRAMTGFDIEVDETEVPGGPSKRRVVIRKTGEENGEDGEDNGGDDNPEVI